MRLIPAVDDSYQWLPQPDVAHLFEKQFSKHNVTSYKKLFFGIGRSFEVAAVHKEDPRHAVKGSIGTRFIEVR